MFLPTCMPLSARHGFERARHHCGQNLQGLFGFPAHQLELLDGPSNSRGQVTQGRGRTSLADGCHPLGTLTNCSRSISSSLEEFGMVCTNGPYPARDVPGCVSTTNVPEVMKLFVVDSGNNFACATGSDFNMTWRWIDVWSSI